MTELSIREVCINGKSCNLQLLQLFPEGIVSQLKTISFQLKPYSGLNIDKLEPTLNDFFAKLKAVEHLSFELGGDAAGSRALCKSILTVTIPKSNITQLKTVKISA